MAVSLQMTIPASSDFYTTGGDITITLEGVDTIIFHTKKELIKIQKAKTTARQDSLDTDMFDNSIVDLKKGTDEVVIKGWLADNSTSTAWEQFWQLRAMIARGGPLTNLTIENIQYKATTQEAYLEDIAGTIKADDTGSINSAQADGTAKFITTPFLRYSAKK